MSFQVTIQQRIQKLKKIAADELPDILYNAAKEATERAVQATTAATPPKEGTGRGSGYSGTNTLTGELKAHWATDSITEPMGSALSGGAQYTTILKNEMEYASFVNNGHRMKKHFVPGLYVDLYSGLLEYDPDADVGIVVGTKTKYVGGEFMTDKGIEEYQKALKEILDQKIAEVFK